MTAHLRQTTRVLGVLLMGLALEACLSSKDLYKGERSKSAREAGSVHVSVLAVAPWSHYVQALQPDFELTADQARDMVVRTTRRVDRGAFESSGLSVDAEDTGAVTGPAPLGLAPLPVAGVSVHSYRDRPYDTPTDTVDAMSEYWTAMALYQEVQLLNGVVRDAAIPRGYRPYLVRLQVSLMPRRRHSPYDVYTTLSFFTSSSDSSTEESADVAEGVLPTGLRDGDFGDGAPAGARILPLLVTDNLEASSESNSIDILRELSFSLLSTAGDFISDVGADLFQEQMRAAVEGRDLNSLLTVARVSENTLRVRLGAMHEVTAGYAMVPRNHNVTLLLMIPEGDRDRVRLLTETKLVDVDTGETLQDTSEKEIAKLFMGVGESYGLDEDHMQLLRDLFRTAQTNDARGFDALLAHGVSRSHKAFGMRHSLWLELVSLQAGSRFQSTFFELPGHGVLEIESDQFFDQTVLVHDDGESATAILGGARFNDVAKVKATLIIVGGSELVESDILLPSVGLELDANTGALRAKFPSIRGLGLDGEASQPGRVEVLVRWSGEEQRFSALYLQNSSAE